MKLELKHYAAYLAHKLKYFDITQLPNVFVLDTETLDGVINDSDHLGTIRFLLRPLSNLTKEEYSGIYNLLRVHIGKRKLNTLINEGYGLIDLPYFIFENLSELHFDIFGLIEKGLAVDINTLSK